MWHVRVAALAGWILPFLVLAPCQLHARDWYARPYVAAGYLGSNGQSYQTAFNGLHAGAIKWPAIAPGDVVRICGFHDGGGFDYGEHKAAHPVIYVIGRKGLPGKPITITGDCPNDPGTIFGAGMSYSSGWTLFDETYNIYRRTCKPYPNNLASFRHIHARHNGADRVQGINLLKSAAEMNPASWEPGTFYRAKDDTCYFKPASGSANDYTVYLAYEYPNINFQDVAYFRVEDITLLNGNNASWGSSIGIREKSSHVVVDRVRIRWADGVAIGVGANNSHVAITNSTISDSGLGIYFSGETRHVVVSGNEILDLNQRGEYGDKRSDLHAIALQGGGDDFLIEKNHIHRIGGDGIVFYFDPRFSRGLTNVVIRNNHIHDAQDLSGGGRSQRAIEFGGNNIPAENIYDNVIYGNYIHDIGSPEDDGDSAKNGIGIRLKAISNPSLSSSWSVYDNVIDNASIGLVWIHDNDPAKGPGFTFAKNTVINSRSQHIYLYAIQNGTFRYDGANIRDNVYFPDGWKKFGYFSRFNVPGVLHDPKSGNLRQWQNATGKDQGSVILPGPPATVKPPDR